MVVLGEAPESDEEEIIEKTEETIQCTDDSKYINYI